MGTVTVRVTDSGGTSTTTSVTYTVGSPLLLGASNADNATEIATYEGRFGTLKIRRSYNQPSDDLPATWAACAAGIDANRRASVWSFKPNVVSVAAGGYDARIRTFLASIPRDGFVKWLLMHHEPEGEIKSGAFTTAQYKSAQARWSGLVKETARTDLVPAVCFAGTQTFDGQTAFTADDLTPAGMAVTFDAYNKWPQSGFAWKELSDRAGLQVAWAKASGRRWGISETGCYEDTSQPQRKTTWTRNAVDFVRSNGGEFFCYWDNAFASDPNQTLRRLHSSTQHIAAWRELSA